MLALKKGEHTPNPRQDHRKPLQVDRKHSTVSPCAGMTWELGTEGDSAQSMRMINGISLHSLRSEVKVAHTATDELPNAFSAAEKRRKETLKKYT